MLIDRRRTRICLDVIANEYEFWLLVGVHASLAFSRLCLISHTENNVATV